ncbi:hypothetical protein Y695_04856 [Hydrogenophaga sp. T4]|nr:hypothetical protein Y695_04856 [Hydrogenophaga sp. T4]
MSVSSPWASRAAQACFRYSSMITPNSAATPASAMKPTTLATDRLCPNAQSNQMPPMRAKGSVAMMSRASSRRRKVRYSSRKITSSVNGTTSLSCALARSRNSNWPDHDTE